MGRSGVLKQKHTLFHHEMLQKSISGAEKGVLLCVNSGDGGEPSQIGRFLSGCSKRYNFITD